MARQRHPCHIGEMQEHICRCGARYEVTYVQSRFRDRDRQDCEVCGLKWTNGTRLEFRTTNWLSVRRFPRATRVKRAPRAADRDLPLWIVSRIRSSKSEEIAAVRAKDSADDVAAVVKQRALTDPEFIKRLAARPG